MIQRLFAAVVAVMLCAGCAGRGGTKTTTETNVQSQVTDTPKQYSYKIKAVYPHSTAAYTQGLIWQEGILIEGTGGYGESKLRRVELTSGKELKSVALDGEYFGEGVVQLNGKIYQLTWREGKVFVYDADSFKLLKEFNISGEGWGITTDGEQLYMSDGSDAIYVIDPETFDRKRAINVRAAGNRVEMLNELEWIGGEIWANVYMSDFIVKIDPATGKVTGVIDLDGLSSQVEQTPRTDVLNGIAYDSTANRVFVTGKNWNKLFEIEIVEKK